MGNGKNSILREIIWNIRWSNSSIGGAGNLNRRGKLERTGGVCGVGPGVVGIGRDLHGLAISRRICTAPKQPPHLVTV